MSLALAGAGLFTDGGVPPGSALIFTGNVTNFGSVTVTGSATTTIGNNVYADSPADLTAINANGASLPGSWSLTSPLLAALASVRIGSSGATGLSLGSACAAALTLLDASGNAIASASEIDALFATLYASATASGLTVNVSGGTNAAPSNSMAVDNAHNLILNGAIVRTNITSGGGATQFYTGSDGAASIKNWVVVGDDVIGSANGCWEFIPATMAEFSTNGQTNVGTFNFPAAYSAFTSIRIIAAGCTGFQIAVASNLTLLDLSGNAITSQSEIDAILLALVNGGLSNGTVNLSGGTMASQSSTGTDYCNTLVTAGWSVTTNGFPVSISDGAALLAHVLNRFWNTAYHADGTHPTAVRNALVAAPEAVAIAIALAS